MKKKKTTQILFGLWLIVNDWMKHGVWLIVLPDL
jgi:hypothetical protein